MDLQTAFNWLGGAAIGIIGFLCKRAVKVSDDLNAFQLDVARNYVTHADLVDIKALLVRIEQKLDGKADK